MLMPKLTLLEKFGFIKSNDVVICIYAQPACDHVACKVNIKIIPVIAGSVDLYAHLLSIRGRKAGGLLKITQMKTSCL